VGVEEYALFALGRKRGPQLSGYRRDAAGRFVAWRPDRRGVLWSKALGGLGLFVEERLWLRAVDADGRRLPTPDEIATAEATARQAAERRAAEEAAARAEAEAEVARLREELRRLREHPGDAADGPNGGW
jgi:hypothetical protein